MDIIISTMESEIAGLTRKTVNDIPALSVNVIVQSGRNEPRDEKVNDGSKLDQYILCSLGTFLICFRSS